MISINPFRVLWQETAALLRIDVASAVVALVIILMAGLSLSRYTDNAALLNSFIPDEPLITMQLDGMTAVPWGDPSNYLDTGSTKKTVPARWLNIRYVNIPYYGGLYLDLALIVWAPLNLLGLPLFPTAPIILRAISLFFSVLTLVALYNFGRRHFGVIAGLSGPFFLLTETYFVGLSSVIHPDTLLFFLCIVGLALSIRHANDGELGSLLALGIVAGLAQGAKMGGPLLVPIVVASIFLGTRVQGEDFFSTIRKAVVRGAAVAGVAIFVFLLTTPYLVLGTYYLETWRIWARTFAGQSPMAPITFLSWLSQSADHIGHGLVAVASLALLANIAASHTRETRIALALTAGIGLSIFLWYALFQHYWVQLQYLLVAFALVAMLAGSLLDKILSVRPTWMMTRFATTAIAVCLLLGGLALTKARALYALGYSINNFAWKDSPAFQVGDWVSRNQPVTNGRVLYDLQAYFDPSIFPSQYPNGGPVRWVDLARVRPDYFALTVYGSRHWMGEKMKSQNMTKWDPDYWNMKLYQDLLGKDADNVSSGNPFPFITQVARFASPKCDSVDAPFFSRIALVCLVGPITDYHYMIILFKLDADHAGSDLENAQIVQTH